MSMFTTTRFASRLPGLLARQQQQITNPAIAAQAYRNSSWVGTNADDHAVNRTKKRDNTDVSTDASSAGQEDRESSYGVPDSSKPAGATERGGLKHERKAKKEHPKAPEPVIGMNDERGQRGH
ncbi:hypothetical protein BO86DRAFT_385680 [Aspergillus japonicus CBS 114.51]|uniref:Uncharacterized protein n=2 Tax=Aspergillus TaxID=5052 RepID=A0A2V5H1B0_ASPV1|nr:hypothetical protein BO86DRAFT_385680 [Aspergillus japonicus CBS 114.51]PYI14543.1 hypothetical protein BO99DRAFT_406610 [Aspergillus violaceofuscus CBS 115571]RAH86117.1 hypothetical protein BO86DRAFT_385680 [Aspergillus japonicus CBS 114.51]